jgi:hypothetical protein
VVPAGSWNQSPTLAKDRPAYAVVNGNWNCGPGRNELAPALGGRRRELLQSDGGASEFHVPNHYPPKSDERLTDGEYMIVFGQVAASGFEFGVHCMEKNAPAKMRVE